MNKSEKIAENTSRESGFYKYSGTNYSTVMNLKGHSKLYWDSNEPETRLVGTIPLWIHYKGVNLIPSVPFSHGRFAILPTTNKLKKQFYKALNKFFTWRHYNPTYVGFNFFYDKGTKQSIVEGYQSYSIQTNNKETSIKGKTKISSMKLGIFHLLNKSFKEVFLKSKEQYVWESKIEGEKIIIFSDNSIEFTEKQNLKNVTAINFVIRTFEDVILKKKGNKYLFVYKNQKVLFTVNKELGDSIHVKKKKSSTGKQKVWIIKNKHNQVESTTRKITFAEV